MGAIKVHPSTKIPKTVLLVLLALFGLVSIIMSVALDIDWIGPYLVVGVIFGLFMVRSIFQLIILRKTTYTISEDVLQKEFNLLFRRYKREVPITQVKGLELSQTALQNWLGFGDITVITAGPNRSLGFVEFSQIPAPEEKRSSIKEYVF